MRSGIKVVGSVFAAWLFGIVWVPGCSGTDGGFHGNGAGSSGAGGQGGLGGTAGAGGSGGTAGTGGTAGAGGASGSGPDGGSTGTTDSGCDAGNPDMCGSAVGPTVSAGCSSCSGSSCQANGCYGGWWCDTSTNKCESPPTSCPPSPCGDSGSSGVTDSSGGSGDSSSGGDITCPGPGSPKSNGSSCGVERWAVKTGTDPGASKVSLVPTTTTIATLTGVPANPGGYTTRTSPYETTLWELKDVTLTFLRLETDSDYHMVVSDGSNTMITEIPYPGGCDKGSSWSCFISRSRSEVDAKYTVTSSSTYPGVTVTVRGVGLFDSIHGQTGVAPNGIELHPVLQICFGKGCTPS